MKVLRFTKISLEGVDLYDGGQVFRIFHSEEEFEEYCNNVLK